MKTTFNTVAKEVNDQIKSEIPFRPWQYQDYNIVSVNYETILSDIETYWTSEARMREGFSVDEETKTLYLPNFFTKVNGICNDKKDYENFVLMLRGAKNTVKISEKNFFETKDIVNLIGTKKKKYENTFINTEELMKKALKTSKDDNNENDEDDEDRNEEDFTFFELSAKNLLHNRIYAYEIDKDKSTFSNLTSAKQKQFVKMMEKVMQEKKAEWNEEEMLSFISVCVQMPDSIITLINNFDFSFDVPKIIVTTNKISKDFSMYLFILNELCFDIILLEPSGKTSIEKYMDINELSLGYFVENFDLTSIKTPEEKVLDEQKKAQEKIENKKKKKQEKKEDMENFFEHIFWNLEDLWEDVIAPLLFYGMCIFYIIFYVWGAFSVDKISGTTYLITCIVWGIIIFFFGFYVIDNTDVDDDLAMLFVLIAIVGAIFFLLGRLLYYAGTTEEFNRNTHTHDGFSIIEEEEIEGNGDFIIHYKPYATMRKNHNAVYCYIENNADNTESMYFVIKYKNSVIYESAAIEPMTYVPRINLRNSDFPVGEHSLTIDFYKYDEDAENKDTEGSSKFTDELIYSGYLNLTVTETNKDFNASLKEYSLETCSH